ncbi:6-pyruvoyl-tetrahydropterin synthase-related protein [Dysgonomonas sp. Marseille-P4361]|uniref:6-pyruvoyl-tetrahydropterin synthase-related protein n=1 Tax=Dysgonomonas sp. Marseille-P4361 TaxID=2161820 RepID=UPI000D55A7CE|nr:6-pyruvoyl-tetrahydropterin synthase-related protein [Dysgonomonas sp. Marseille-P4361]
MITLSSEKTTIKKEFWVFLATLIFLSLFMILWCGPLSKYLGHDFHFHLIRFNVLIEAIKEGTYPIYIDYGTLEGYGYFTKAFYPDLTILPFAIIGTVIEPIVAYNIMMFTYSVLCGLFMYLVVNTIFKNFFAAFVSAIVYTFSPYHLFDWYNRAALGESISFAFLPIIFLGLYHIIAGDYKKWYILSIGYSLIIYTHLLSSFLTFIATVFLLLICCKLLFKEPKRIQYLLLAAGVTVLVTASYLLPMFEQMLSNTFYYSTNENVPGQMKQYPIQMFWGMLNGFLYPEDPFYMHSVSGTGPLLILLILLRFFVKEKTVLRKIADLCLVLGLIFLFMVSSYFPWGRLPLDFVQFPWRLYEFVVFFFAIAGAYYLSVLIKTKKVSFIAVSAIVIATTLMMVRSDSNYKNWQSIVKRQAPYYYFNGIPSIENQYLLGMAEYIPVKVPSLEFINERGDEVNTTYPNTEISNFSKNKGLISFNIKTEALEKVELPYLYYKGYKAVNKAKEEFLVEESDHGLVQVEVTKSTDIEVYYAGTIIQKISWYITLLSILGLIVYIIYSKRKDRISV